MQQASFPHKIIFSFIQILFMVIQHREKESRGMFFIEEEGEIIAEIVYAKGGDSLIIIEHTEVDEKLKGQNIGYELVHHVVEYARSHNLKVSPICPFAKAVFDKRADFHDVLA